ncbi:MAG: ABC transporter substrate-binding protein, partial [Acidimicrobiales bacterium]
VLACAAAVSLVAACGPSGGGRPGSGTCATTAGPGPRGVLAVAAINGTEPEIVTQLYALCLALAGYVVSPTARIGSRETALPALGVADIDLYPEYVGTLLTFLAGTPSSDLGSTLAELRQVLAARGVTLLDPAPAENRRGFAVSAATAARLGLARLSDLRPVAGQLVFGGGPDCPAQAHCLPGLERIYGLRFKEVRRLDAGGPATEQALVAGDIDVATMSTSDAAVAAHDFVILTDDRGLSPVDNLVPAVRTERLTPDIAAVLNRLSAGLTTADLAEMNRQVEVDRKGPAEVAARWLKENGYSSR